MKHTQDKINKIWREVKNNEDFNNPPELQPIILSDDEAEQSISIPNSEGSSREMYSRRNEEEEWQVTPYVGEKAIYGL